jgi:predicted aldo/keto reductase-like oxidoreductase
LPSTGIGSFQALEATIMAKTEKEAISRRAFVGQTGIVAGAAMLGAQTALGQPAPHDVAPLVPGGVPRRILGRTGVPITTFTLGTAACGSLPPAEIAQLVRTALDEGVTAVDTSQNYQNAQEGVGLALANRRKDVFLSTKVFANNIADAEKSLSTSIRLLKTDCFDVLYYHGLGNLNIQPALEPDGVFTWLVKQKKAGKCRFLGASSHNLPGRFPRFLETGELDVILVTLNFVDRHTYNFEDRVLPLARKHNVGVVAMKVFGGGAGLNYKKLGRAHLDDQYLPLSLRYALSLPGVASADLGCCTAQQVRHNVQMVKQFTPLSAGEQADLLKIGKDLAAKWGEYLGPVNEKPAG